MIELSSPVNATTALTGNQSTQLKVRTTQFTLHTVTAYYRAHSSLRSEIWLYQMTHRPAPKYFALGQALGIRKPTHRIDALKQAGCEKTYQGITNSAKSARPELEKLLASVPARAVRMSADWTWAKVA